MDILEGDTSKLDVGTLGVDFCTLGQHVGDPGVHWEGKGDTLGSRVGFSVIFDEFRDPLWSRF